MLSFKLSWCRTRPFLSPKIHAMQDSNVPDLLMARLLFNDKPMLYGAALGPRCKRFSNELIIQITPSSTFFLITR